MNSLFARINFLITYKPRRSYSADKTNGFNETIKFLFVRKVHDKLNVLY